MMLSILLLGFLVGDRTTTLLALLTVLLLRMTGVGAPATAVVLPIDAHRARSVARRALEVLRLGAGTALIVGLLVMAWVPIDHEGVDHKETVLEHEVLRHVPQVSGLTMPSWRAYIAALVLLWLVGVVWRYRILVILGDRTGPLSGQGASPTTRIPPLKGLYAGLRRQQSGPELLYRDHAPLVGLGVPWEEWAIALELLPAKGADGKPLRLQPIDASILHRAITLRVSELRGGREYPGDALHRLTVSDRVFRPGLRRGPAMDWLGGMSASTADANRASLLDHRWATALDLFGHERLRHYLTVRIGSWQEELVTTVLIRALTQGRVLHVEFQAYLLPPVAEVYHAVDRFAPVDPVVDGLEVLTKAAASMGRDMGAALGQVVSTSRSVARAARARRHYRRLVRGGYAIGHAPRVSVRELGAAEQFQNPFQFDDVARFISTLTLRVHTAIHAELKVRGYDTSALETQAQNIVNNINQGVQISGGNQHGPIAGGPGARAQRVTVPRPQMGAR
ncbi:hypothetical protein JGB26_37170 [Streptomyces flavofungini]|uniref:Uncharacterized protein n=1 Tax=Streptomyces flavofungini TaxID=68200 RepID=A0ABS0XI31_9ACTN|nr:hypothetical protein [Streptomyces flavofungini]MBJ3812641.1 hypothetical protein [Streptomyces flavofungini]